MRNYLFFLLIICLLGCSTAKPSQNYYEENTDINLFAFIGKKISVISFNPYTELKEKKVFDSATGKYIPRNLFVQDNVYKCRYEIIENVFNNPKIDTIEFFALDHYGIPSFEKYDTVLLYLTKSDDGEYFQVKYQFDKVKKNKKGQYYGLTFDKTIENNKTIFKNERIITLKELFLVKKTGVLKSMFDN